MFAYHLDLGWATGGFLGVDTFFVLSGFLITSLLLNEYARDKAVSFTSFWARRARRLLPALFVVLIAVAVYAAFIADSSTLDDLRSDMFATLFYGANWRFINSGQSYFALFSEASPLRHSWSLAIEEQFYLVWPLIVFGCLRLAKGSRRLLAGVCVAGTVASALWMAWLYDSANLSRAYYGTDSHAQLLLVGALLAIVLTRWSPQRPGAVVASQAAGILAIGVVLVSFVLVDDTDAFMYRGGYLVFAVRGEPADHVGDPTPAHGAARRALARTGRVARPRLLRHLSVALAHDRHPLPRAHRHRGCATRPRACRRHPRARDRVLLPARAARARGPAVQGPPRAPSLPSRSWRRRPW